MSDEDTTRTNTTARFREERSGGNEGTSDDEPDGGLSSEVMLGTGVIMTMVVC